MCVHGSTSFQDDISYLRLIYATRADQLARLAELQQAAQAASPKAGHSHG